jgi:hypothetical protein
LAAQPATLLDASYFIGATCSSSAEAGPATSAVRAIAVIVLLIIESFIGDSSGFYKISRKNLAAAYRETVGNTGELFKIG